MGEAAKAAVEETGRLELGTVGNRRVHVLCGRVVQRGDHLELLLTGNVWLCGRYDWSGMEARWPALRVELGGAWESLPPEAWKPAAVLALHPDAVLRWPR